MANPRSSLTSAKELRALRPINILALIANGKTDCKEYCKRIDLERVREWIRQHFFEEAEEA